MEERDRRWGRVYKGDPGNSLDGEVGDVMLLIPDDDFRQAAPADNRAVKVPKAGGVVRGLRAENSVTEAADGATRCKSINEGSFSDARQNVGVS